jgi:hypothetical protein
MAVPTFSKLPDDSNLETVVNGINKVIAELEWICGGAIDFKNIKAQGIITENLKALSVITEKIAAGAVTADKITVAELSAITADLGHITAGLIEAVTIVGSEIMTKEAGTYPRIVLSSTDDILTAEQAAGDSIQIIASYSGTPTILFNLGGAAKAIMSVAGGGLGITTTGTTAINLQAAGPLSLDGSSISYNGNTGWTGVFQDLAGESVIVQNGIITSVV